MNDTLYCSSRARASSRLGAGRGEGYVQQLKEAGSINAHQYWHSHLERRCKHSQSLIHHIPRTTGACKGLQGHSWVVQMRGPFTARATAESALTLQRRWEWTTGSQGGTRTHAMFLASALRWYPPRTLLLLLLLLWNVLSARCEDGRRCCELNRRLKGLRHPCGWFPHLQVLKLCEYGSTGVDG